MILEFTNTKWLFIRHTFMKNSMQIIHTMY